MRVLHIIGLLQRKMQSDVKTLLGLANQTRFTIILEEVEPKRICCSVNSWKEINGHSMPWI